MRVHIVISPSAAYGAFVGAVPLKDWIQPKRRAGHRPRVKITSSITTAPNHRWATDLALIHCGLHRIPRHRMPDGLLSDTRAAASLVDLCGTDALERLPGRWVFFERDFTELFGDWQRWQGMRVSNLDFLPRIYTRLHQATLKFPSTCGYPDTSRCRK